MDSHALPLPDHAAGTPPAPRAPRLLRAARIIHPFPTLLNVAATAGLAFVAARGAPDASTLARMLAVMLCAQSAIGVTNDVFDRELDAGAKPWKPIVAGLVSPPAAIALALALIAATLALASTLGAAGFGLAALGLGCGLAYDVRLKRTALSALPFMIAIPTLPLWVWATLGEWRAALWWLPPFGALIGLALHLANTVPDIESDAASGVRGLAQRLGARRSMIVAWASFGIALAFTLVLLPFAGYDLRAYVPTATLAGAALAASIATYVRLRDAAALRSGFALLSAASAVLAVGWLAAVT